MVVQNLKICGEAPLPKRDFFVSRAVKSTTEQQLLEYLKYKGIRDVEIICVSIPQATFKSFKLTVPIKEKRWRKMTLSIENDT